MRTRIKTDFVNGLTGERGLKCFGKVERVPVAEGDVDLSIYLLE